MYDSHDDHRSLETTHEHVRWFCLQKIDREARRFGEG